MVSAPLLSQELQLDESSPLLAELLVKLERTEVKNKLVGSHLQEKMEQKPKACLLQRSSESESLLTCVHLACHETCAGVASAVPR